MHVVSEEARAAAKKQAGSLELANVLCKATCNVAFSLKSNVKPPVISADGSTFNLVDGLVNRQGPNYALAKRMQHWRAVVARQENGCTVSSNIAPSTATASVVSNKLFALGYIGMKYFKPMEVFQQETSNAVMGALLLRDLNDPATPANAILPLKNPLQLFTNGSFHGGVWRMAYTMDSIAPACLLACFLEYFMKILAYFLLFAMIVFLVVMAKNGEDPFKVIQGLVKGEL